MIFKKMLHYINPLTLFKKDENKSGINLKLMHGINRISIFMFLIGLIILVIKWLR
jgi:hypothetical protein